MCRFISITGTRNIFQPDETGGTDQVYYRNLITVWRAMPHLLTNLFDLLFLMLIQAGVDGMVKVGFFIIYIAFVPEYTETTVMGIEILGKSTEQEILSLCI
jgi:hypothetical protein